jgi:multiple sugar transport system ATP-binding protein
MAQITLDDVTKRYPDGFEAVKHLNLEIADGEFLVLVGPSGCGKSTALRMIAGLEDITEGELDIDGRKVNDLAPKDRDIAMVFQNYALYPHMTVRENMGFALKIAKVDRAEIDRKVNEASKVLDLDEHLDRKPANLSGGQRQRVAMGRAIVRDPKAFLMDEPLSNLDAKLRVQMRATVSRIQQRMNTTTVYVTHDQTEALTLGDRVAVLRAGELQQVDTPKALYGSPVNLFVAGFIGSPAMNFFDATVKGETVHLPFAEVPLTGALRDAVKGSDAASRPLIAGLRPEHFYDPAVDEHPGGVTFDVGIAVVESVGSEIYVHFSYEGEGPESAQLAELAADSGADDAGRVEGSDAVARLNPDSGVAIGQPATLALRPEELFLFDAEHGHNLAHADAQKQPAAPEPAADRPPPTEIAPGESA